MDVNLSILVSSALEEAEQEYEQALKTWQKLAMTPIGSKLWERVQMKKQVINGIVQFKHTMFQMDRVVAMSHVVWQKGQLKD